MRTERIRGRTDRITHWDGPPRAWRKATRSWKRDKKRQELGALLKTRKTSFRPCRSYNLTRWRGLS